jgi:hypothetical protein
MKRFAAHYLYLPDKGFYKQFVVEIKEETVRFIYPLEAEQERVSWHSGVILLSPLSDRQAIRLSEIEFADGILSTDRHRHQHQLDTFPLDLSSMKYYAYLLTPFDFSAMRPVAETRHIPLR